MKLVMFLFLVTVSFVLTSCGSDESKTANATNSPPQQHTMNNGSCNPNNQFDGCNCTLVDVGAGFTQVKVWVCCDDNGCRSSGTGTSAIQ